MAEKLNYGEMSQDAKIIICEALGNLPINHPAKFPCNPNLEIEFKINGFEVSFERVVKLISSSLEDMVTKRAKELIKEKNWELSNKVQKFIEAVEDEGRETFKWSSSDDC